MVPSLNELFEQLRAAYKGILSLNNFRNRRKLKEYFFGEKWFDWRIGQGTFTKAALTVQFFAYSKKIYEWLS